MTGIEKLEFRETVGAIFGKLLRNKETAAIENDADEMLKIISELKDEVVASIETDREFAALERTVNK